MTELTLVQRLKMCAVDAGYELLAEDVQRDESYLEPDQFVVKDANGCTYYVGVVGGAE